MFVGILFSGRLIECSRNLNLQAMNRSVIILGPAWPLRGGIANFNEAFYRAYESTGADVSIVSFSLQYPSVLFPGKSQKESDTRSDPGLRIHALVNSVNPFSWVRAARFINKQQPDYVIVRFWLPFMAMSLGSILRLLNKKIYIIALVDNAIPHESRPGDRILTKYFMKAPHAFVTMSRAVLKDLAQFTSTPHLRFVPHPVYDIYGSHVDKFVARKKLGLGEHEKVILFFGFVRKYKGLELLLHAMADVRLQEMNVKLLLAGEFYDDPEPYHQLISALHLNDRVLIHDHFIPADEIAHYFCAADIITQTYLSATQSGVTQIAYHFGRPMLVTDVGGLAEIVDDNQGGYVTPVTSDAVADALVDFYRNAREEAMATHVIARAADFSWDSMIREMEDLYLKLK